MNEFFSFCISFPPCSIVANSQHNRMTAQSVAIVFGPTLMWTQKEAFNIAMNMVQQNQCIEFLLTEHKNIF